MYSCSDFTSDVINRLAAHNLISVPMATSDDLEAQGTAATEAITSLADNIVVLARLLEHLVGKLSVNDVQPPLPLGACMLGSIEPALRDKITTLLKADEIERAVQGAAARFMTELQDVHGSLADVGELCGNRTLADLGYLHSAIHKKSYIEVDKISDSRVLEVVRQLPSAAFWLQHIFVVEESKAA